MARLPKMEFARRLYRVRKAIDRYLETGVPCDLFPSLFSLYGYMWCKNPDKDLMKDGLL